MGVIGVKGVAGVMGFSGNGDIPLWNEEVDWTLGGYRCEVWKDKKFTVEKSFKYNWEIHGTELSR
jgi:hypothetical protein